MKSAVDLVRTEYGIPSLYHNTSVPDVDRLDSDTITCIVGAFFESVVRLYQ